MNEEILELLYRSFDTGLTAEDRLRLDQALGSSEVLRAEKERIASMRNVISNSTTRSFKPFFAERVMRAIENDEDKHLSTDLFFESLYRFFRPVAVIAAAAVVLMISLNLWDSDDVTLAAVLGVQEDSIEEMFETPLETILEEPL